MLQIFRNKGGKTWRSKIALIQAATAKFRRESRFPEAGDCTAVLIAPTPGHLGVAETAVAVIRIAGNDNDIDSSLDTRRLRWRLVSAG
jgi:hypothetical protein